MRKPVRFERGKMAAVFIDLQEEHRNDTRYLVEGFATIIANVMLLQAAARSAGIPLFHSAYVVDSANHNHLFHPRLSNGKSAFSDKDDPWTAICTEVAPLDGELLTIKAEASAFGHGSPATDLKERGIEWVIISGVWTEACIDASVKDAIRLGFRVLLVKDACGSGTIAMHEMAALNIANRLYGGAITDTAGAIRLMAGEEVEVWMVEGSVPFRITYENAAALYRNL
jgi:maleamate amidohydrolase